MTRRTTPVASASAIVLCLGVLLTGCGAAGSGYAAVGPAGPLDGTARTTPVAPPGRVELTPLDGGDHGPARPGPSGGPPGPSTGPTGSAPAPGSATPPATPPHGSPTSPGTTGAPGPTPDPGPGTNPSSPSGGSSSPQPGGSSPTPVPPSPTVPAGPDAPPGLVVGKPVLADTDVRWCQQVTIDFLNTGDHPVTTGTVTLGSHVIDALGIDWATVDSPQSLPLPLIPGKPATGSWRVCVDAWRVPPGMHLDTKDVTFKTT
ncbi:hypothetical protein [Streptomyces sp. NPDC093707]|uniref:hypothetical protein n=1 Tax=Streptomyces sp. NPDC093707 TaxID=3154984 RepID=UPI00344C638A